MFDTHKMTADATTKAIKSIATRSKSVTTDIHRAAVAIVLQSLPHNLGGHLDASKALPLIQALSAGMPRNKVVNWFALYSNIRVTVTKKGTVFTLKLLKPADDGYKALTEADIKQAIAKPYWDAFKEPDINPMDTDKVIADLMKRIASGIKDGKVKDPVRAAAQLAGLRKLNAPSDEVPFA